MGPESMGDGIEMAPLLFGMLILLFLFPALFLPILFLFAFLLLFFIPLQFTFQSLAVLVTAPKQIYHIAMNPRLRKNHALEHATINVLEERFGKRLPLSGYAEKEGFFLRGNIDALLVEEAAREGLRRLQGKESNLAIHRQCGTSLLAANLLSAVLFLFLLLSTGIFSLIYVLLAILLANVVGPFLGMYLQKLFTTKAKVDDMAIKGVEFRSPPRFPHGVWYFVRTVQLKSL